MKFKTQTLAIVLLIGSAFSMQTFAATQTYDMVQRSALTNVDDREGRWQFSGGDLYRSGSHVGWWISKKRVSFGQSANKAAVETTLIWKYGHYSLTVQGTHYFGDGTQVGAVSAASAGWTYLKDATVRGTHESLTFTY